MSGPKDLHEEITGGVTDGWKCLLDDHVQSVFQECIIQAARNVDQPNTKKVPDGIVQVRIKLPKKIVRDPFIEKRMSVVDAVIHETATAQTNINMMHKTFRAMIRHTDADSESDEEPGPVPQRRPPNSVEVLPNVFSVVSVCEGPHDYLVPEHLRQEGIYHLPIDADAPHADGILCGPIAYGPRVYVGALRAYWYLLQGGGDAQAVSDELDKRVPLDGCVIVDDPADWAKQGLCTVMKTSYESARDHQVYTEFMERYKHCARLILKAMRMSALFAELHKEEYVRPFTVDTNKYDLNVEHNPVELVVERILTGAMNLAMSRFESEETQKVVQKGKVVPGFTQASAR
ncbi:uncharacterized protein B0H18DRAFT_985757 [Fomitopsis serialis]|uniref:uncharacterized protein n=1 Tax=Fomitopsis serialis TaxID=139415 RepID=UPI00200809AB|nr:uncharacterized protein B0H18DRAFT_985757 [Neoantrodia serialis]KAH9932478.1 hypothetical protein B0H18DRAFT_985757 [Neoantrodia serialis]